VRSTWPSLRFLLQTEVHVYSFAVAANILISFFPFLVAMLIFCRFVLHWQAAVDVIFQTLNNYFPEGFGVNFRGYLNAVAFHSKFSWLSIFLLFFTANGIFTPLEVALNRIWRVKENRSLFLNQMVSLGLIFACGMLVLASICLTTVNVRFLTTTFGASRFAALLPSIGLKMTALPITMLMIFLVYWLLPNAKIPIKRLIPVSAAVAILLELSKWINIITWPYLRAKLSNEVPPFVQSISIILWSFIGTMILLAGAEWSARVVVETLEPDPAR
jgi:membrane protein